MKCGALLSKGLSGPISGQRKSRQTEEITVMKTSALATMVAILLLGVPMASMAGVAPDTDNDGVPDVLDNCVDVANAPPLDCDTDGDGYGNRCDADFNQDGAQTGGDVGVFGQDLLAGMDSGIGSDTNCDGALSADDVPIAGAELLSPGLGPGLPCANVLGNPCP